MKWLRRRRLVYALITFVGIFPAIMYWGASAGEYHWLGFIRLNARSFGMIYLLGIGVGIVLTVIWSGEVMLWLRRRRQTHEDDT